ncbi:MAG: hypothetical protein ACJ71K_14850 [Nitrososphaeraceae archaeon]
MKSSPSSNDEVQKESSEPDYNEDGDQLEAKTGEMTINQVF